MPLRYAAILIAAVMATHVDDVLSWRRAAGAGEAGTGKSLVILVVADGLRWQEVFRGADPAIAGERGKYWRSSLDERREALMPFVWSTIAREGQLLGNRDRGSSAVVTNPMKFSYPGYNEMLVGYPDARIDRNDFGPNPNVTVFEWMNDQRGLRGRVAAFGMWDTFRDIFNVRRSGLPVHDFATDTETYAAALKHLRRGSSRAMFVGFGATDDFAHKERYDLVLDAAHAIDGYVARLWAAAQSIPAHRGRTTLILVADHGRGRTARDWMHHNHDVPGSDETWFAVIGSGIPSLGERRDARDVTLAQTAATVARALRLDYRATVPRAQPALSLVPGRERVVAERR